MSKKGNTNEENYRKHQFKRWTKLYQRPRWWLNVTVITKVIFLICSPTKQVWRSCRATVMGSLLESRPELPQCLFNQSFTKQEICADEIAQTSTTPHNCLEVLHLLWINCEIVLESRLRSAKERLARSLLTVQEFPVPQVKDVNVE